MIEVRRSARHILWPLASKFWGVLWNNGEWSTKHAVPPTHFHRCCEPLQDSLHSSTRTWRRNLYQGCRSKEQNQRNHESKWVKHGKAKWWKRQRVRTWQSPFSQIHDLPKLQVGSPRAVRIAATGAKKTPQTYSLQVKSTDGAGSNPPLSHLPHCKSLDHQKLGLDSYGILPKYDTVLKKFFKDWTSRMFMPSPIPSVSHCLKQLREVVKDNLTEHSRVGFMMTKSGLTKSKARSSSPG